MALPVIYFRGGEDTDFYLNGAGPSVTTTAGFFRGSPYSRCALMFPSATPFYYQARSNGGVMPYNLSTFWQSQQVWFATGTGSIAANFYPLEWYSGTASAPVRRLRIKTKTVTANNAAGNTYGLYKVNAAGAETQLGSDFTLAITNAVVFKMDIFIDYQVAGTCRIYTGGKMFPDFEVTGVDFTTDGNATLKGHGYGTNNQSGFTTNGATSAFSESIVADSDTRGMSLQTLPPVANGNTHNFDIGTPAAGNVNEIVLNTATFDGASTAGLKDQYTIGAIASGSWQIIDFAVSGYFQKGFTGPSKLDVGVRSAATDFWSPDISPDYVYGPAQYGWGTDPATLAAWTALPTNIGLLSVT
jgi:hypothetical protein